MENAKPRGLTDQEMKLLTDCLAKNDLPPKKMLQEAEKHLTLAREAHKEHPLINIKLAEAIVKVFRKVIAEWEAIPESAQKWCLGMICYFSLGEDEIDDFDSPIGFEDDAEVVNSCLRMIDREEWCINPADYDEEKD